MPIIEIAISMWDGGPGQAQLGDIVEARDPYYAIGTNEGRRYLWLRVNVDPRLAVALKEADEHKVRRYKVSLEQLAMLCPGLDMGRATDRFAEYQPLLRRGIMSPLPAKDLIIDKRTRRLLDG